MAQPEDALWVAVPAAAAAVYGSAALLRRAALRRVWEQPSTAVGAMAEGTLVRVEGRIRPHGRRVLSPIRGVECVGYNAWVEYLDGDSPTRVPRWFPVANETVLAPFVLEGDDGHAAMVDADRCDVELAIPALPRRTDRGYAELEPVLRRAGDPRLLRGRTLGYVEVAVEPGQRVSVVGRVLRPATGGEGVYRQGARLAELGAPTSREPVQLRLD